MNLEESLALYAQGKDAWNKWAENMLAERAALEEAGEWNCDEDSSNWNAAISGWHERATSTFAEHTFESNAKFRSFQFPADVKFHAATFSGDAQFHAATFSGDAWFTQSEFEGPAYFIDSTFGAEASFRAAAVGSIFSLADATFSRVPDFTQASFSESPRLDDLHIEPRGFRLPILDGVKASFKGNKELRERAARWLKLRGLAKDQHDHTLEQQFFRQELLARRWVIDKFWYPSFFFSVFYQLCSDFGRSLFRPFLWWLASIPVFAGLYLGQHPSLTTWYAGFFAPTAHSCVKGSSEPWISALLLSSHKALVALSGAGEKLSHMYACLYGARGQASGGELAAKFQPVIPDAVTIIGMVQVLYSVPLIFLFLLAVRNHFRIK